MKTAIVCLGLGIATIDAKTFLKKGDSIAKAFSNTQTVAIANGSDSCGATTIPVAIAAPEKDCGCTPEKNCGCGGVAAYNDKEDDCGCDDNVSRPGCTSVGEIAGGCFGNQFSNNNQVQIANNGAQNVFQYGLNGFTSQEDQEYNSNAIPEIQEVRLPGERNRPIRREREVDDCEETDNNLPVNRVASPVYLATNQRETGRTGEFTGNVARTGNTAAKNDQSAGQAAYNNQAGFANQNDNAQYKKAAAQNSSDENIKSSNRAKGCAALKYGKCNTNKNAQKKNNICHAKDNAFHKEEHVANEQKFCHQDEGNCETLECTHICENTFKDKCNNEKADRQIWKKVETCASKCNHKKAAAKALHKACHKKSDKNAFKQAKNCHDQDCNQNVSQDASSGKTVDDIDSSVKTSAAGSSNNSAASSNQAGSGIKIDAGSSANSLINAASSGQVAGSQNVSGKVAGYNNNQSTTPIVQENNDCGC